MKIKSLNLFLPWVPVVIIGCANLKPNSQVPPLDVLSSVVGINQSSKQFTDVLAKYSFSESSKRGNSWGSSFGVFLEQSDMGAHVGFRLPEYSGELPKSLKKGDSTNNILKKLGTPKKSAGNPEVYCRMIFEGVTVYTMWGTLSEVYLFPGNNGKEEEHGPYSYIAMIIDDDIYLKPLFTDAEPFGPFVPNKYKTSFVYIPRGRSQEFGSAKQIYYEEINEVWLYQDNYVQCRALSVDPNSVLEYRMHNDKLQPTVKTPVEPDDVQGSQAHP